MTSCIGFHWYWYRVGQYWFKSQHRTLLILKNYFSFPWTKKLSIPICGTPLSHFLSQARRSNTLVPFCFSHLKAAAAAWLMTAGHFGAVTNYSWEDGTGFEKIMLVAHVFSILGSNHGPLAWSLHIKCWCQRETKKLNGSVLPSHWIITREQTPCDTQWVLGRCIALNAGVSERVKG